NPDGSRGNDGAVFVFQGIGPDGSSRGGVRATPSRFYAGGEPAPGNAQFGRHLVVSDLDGDGKAELIAGEAWALQPNKPNAGAVRVFNGGSLGANPPQTFVSADKADTSYNGADAYTYF